MKYIFTNKEIRKQFKNVSGIYALYYNNEIIYIGKSKDIHNRIRAHNNPNQLNNIYKQIEKENGKCNRDKEVQLYTFIREYKDNMYFDVLYICNEEDLNKYEEYYIMKYQPKYNYSGVDRTYVVN